MANVANGSGIPVLSNIRLTYFNSRARAELSRSILAVVRVSYEDVRIPYTEWRTIKESFPFGKLPVLDLLVDGEPVRLTQSRTIAGFLSRHFGLAGANDIQAAKCQALLDTICDMTEVLYTINPMKDELKRTVELEEYRRGRLKQYMEYFARYFSENISLEGYVVGHQLTYADLAFVDLWDQLECIDGLAFSIKSYPLDAQLRNAPNEVETAQTTNDNFDVLRVHAQRIRAFEPLRVWRESRPVTKY